MNNFILKEWLITEDKAASHIIDAHEKLVK